MIVDAIVGILFGLVSAVLGLLPTYDPPDLGNFGGQVGSALGTANLMFPVTTLGLCIGLVIAAKLFVVGWNVVVFVYDRIPFKLT